MKTFKSNPILIGIIISAIAITSCSKEDDKIIPPDIASPPTIQPPTTGETGTFTDNRDNHTYNWVKVGSQVWMSENLAYTGSDIQHIEDNYDWYNNITPTGWSYYNNNLSNATTYGVLYQWDAAVTACPNGWHLPSEAEWLELDSFLKANGYSYDGISGNNGVAKSLATNSGWTTSSNLGAVGNSDFSNYMNITGFSASPSGYRAFTGEFTKLAKEGYWWDATYDDSGNFAGNHSLKFDNHKIYNNIDNKLYGFSVRCIRD